MTSRHRSAVVVLGMLALAPFHLRAQEAAQPPRAVCRQSATPLAQTFNLSDGFSVQGTGTRQVGDRTQWVWTGDNCAAWIKASTAVSTDASGRALVITAGSIFDAFQQDAQGVREFSISESGRRFRANGRDAVPTVLDDKWLGDMVLEYTRRAGLHAAERAEAILKSGGTSALVAEVEAINSPRVRARYLAMALPSVSPDGRPGFLTEAARRLDRGVAWSALLDAIPSSWHSDPAVLSAIYTASAAIEPDEFVERILQRFPPPHPMSAEMRQLVGILIDTLQTTERRTELRALLLGVTSPAR